jgi:hypothetical protein
MHSELEQFLVVEYDVPAAVAAEERMRLHSMKIKELEEENSALRAKMVMPESLPLTVSHRFPLQVHPQRLPLPLLQRPRRASHGSTEKSLARKHSGSFASISKLQVTFLCAKAIAWRAAGH